jgi:ParB/Sulfiredoxin domain
VAHNGRSPGEGDAEASELGCYSEQRNTQSHIKPEVELQDRCAIGPTHIPLSCIKDGGAQMRVGMRPETVHDYAADMLAGAEFPPIVVFHDGADYWLADGYHRVEAAHKIEHETISADIRQGTHRDAILHGISANATHGLRRTQADKRRAVEALLADPEWARWSDRKIAEAAKVDHKTVAKIRRELRGEIPTGRSLSGEIPKPSGKPSGSIFDDVLRSISDDALIAECRRRGLEVAHA